MSVTSQDVAILDGGGRRLPTITLCLAAAAAYFLLNQQFSGPAYLADEVGYLSNAAFLAGYPSHGASSYYAGYSAIIAPLFAVFSDPGVVWTGILAMNALMWGGTLFLVSHMLERLLPAVAPWKRFLAVAVVALYPANVAMSGYAFSQSAFAFFFAASVCLLMRLRRDSAVSVLPHALLVGYLCCVHPAGFAVALASILTLTLIGFRARGFGIPALGASATLAVVAVYHLWLRPGMIEQMTPAGSLADLHYPTAGQLPSSMPVSERLSILFGMSLGQLSYILFATFGFIGAGLLFAMREGLRGLTAIGQDESAMQRTGVYFILVLSLVGIIGESAVAAALVGGPDRLDQWIYGRYLEPTIGVLLALGLLASWRRGWVIASVLFTVLVGAFLVHGVKISGELYVMNVPALWPVMTGLVSEPMAWFLLAAVGIALAAILNRALVAVLMMVVYAICIPAQRDWHSKILRLNSNPSDIPEFVAKNYRQGQCVGFDVGSSANLNVNRRERANLYSFYLYNSPLLRVTPEQWLKQCEGPLLTFNDKLELPGAYYVGREKVSKLYVVAKHQAKPLLFPSTEPDEQEWLTEVDDVRCLLAGCFGKEGEEFASHSQVGKVSASGVATDGRAGYLTFGPYAFLSAGRYVIVLEGDFSVVDGVRLDVVGGPEQASVARAALGRFLSEDRRTAKIPFDLTADTRRVEVRVSVSKRDELTLSRYRVYINDAPLNPPELGVGLSYEGEQLAWLPYQVGVMRNSRVSSDGRAGFLLFGPYKKLVGGAYRLTLSGVSSASTGSWLDVVSDSGKQSHFKASIMANQSGELIEPSDITLPDVADLEVRVFVAAADKIEISGYSLSAQ